MNFDINLSSPDAEATKESLGFWGTTADIAAGIPRGIAGAGEAVYDLADWALLDWLPDVEDNFGLGHSKTLAGGLTEGISQFMVGFIPGMHAVSWAGRGLGVASKFGKGRQAGQVIKAGRITKAVEAAKAAGKPGKARAIDWTAQFGKATVAGALADFTVFDAQEARLSNLLNQFPALKNPVTEFLAADPNDTEVEGRLKNLLEGGILGAAMEPFVMGLRALRASRQARVAGGDLEGAAASAMSKQRIRNIQSSLGVSAEEATGIHALERAMIPEFLGEVSWARGVGTGAEESPTVLRQMPDGSTAETRQLGAFYSQLDRVIDDSAQRSMTRDQFDALVRKGGVKSEETYWSGLDEYLEGLPSGQMIDLDDVSRNIGGIRVEEVVKSSGGVGARERMVDAWVNAHLDPSEVSFVRVSGGEWQVRTGATLVGDLHPHTVVISRQPSREAAEEAYRRTLRESAEDIPLNEIREGVNAMTGQRLMLLKPGEATKYDKPAYRTPGGQDYRELLITWGNPPKGGGYDVGHFKSSRGEGAKNVLAWIRFDTRVSPATGKRTLFIDEIQSDWHQAGREQGYQTPVDTKGWVVERTNAPVAKSIRDRAAKEGKPEPVGMEEITVRTEPTAAFPEGRIVHRGLPNSLAEGMPGVRRSKAKWKDASDSDIIARAAEINRKRGDAVPDAPFKSTADWTALSMKRIIAHAVENDFDAVAWTTGAHQVRRNQLALAENVDHIVLTKADDGTIKLGGDRAGGRGGFSYNPHPDDLNEYIGKTMADEARAKFDAGETEVRFDVDDFRVGGHGMAEFYDKFVRIAANKIGKRFGTKSEIREGAQRSQDLEAGAIPDAHVMDLTDDLKASVREEGQRLMQADEAAPPKGEVEFKEDGEAIIRGFEASDASTGIHELSHVARRRLFDRSVSPDARRGITDQDIDAVESWAGVSGGRWTVEAEETFARGFERYIRTGKAPNAELQGLFGKLAAWMKEIYQTVRGSEIDIEIPNEIREVFDKLVQRGDLPTLPPPSRGAVGAAGERMLRQGGRAVDTDLWMPPPESLQKISSDQTAQAVKSPGLPVGRYPAESLLKEMGGDSVVNIGAGRDAGPGSKMTKWLEERGYSNTDMDPFHQSRTDYADAVEKISRGGADVAMVNNTLNVIKEAPSRDRVIAQAAAAIQDRGAAVFTVHEGKKTGVGAETTIRGETQWQENRTLKSYVAEVEKHFDDVHTKGKAIIAKSPKGRSPESLAPARLAQAARKPDPRVPTFFSAFSGMGVAEAGMPTVRSVGAVEFNPDAVAAFNTAHGTNYSARAIQEVASEEVRKSGANLFHASPVCKNFSAAKVGGTPDKLDAESADFVARVIREALPPSASVENVRAYMKPTLFARITKALDEKRYTWDVDVYDPADYGGVQTRPRMILRAVLEGALPPLPEKTGPGDWYKAVEDLIEDAPDSAIGDNELWRIGRYVEKGKLDRSGPIITMGGSASKDVPYAANAGGPSPTLLSSPKAVPRILLPDGRMKRVTPRMMARLMGLPDDIPVPDKWATAKAVLGNGIHGEISTKIIYPLAVSALERAPRVLRQADTPSPRIPVGETKPPEVPLNLDAMSSPEATRTVMEAMARGEWDRIANPKRLPFEELAADVNPKSAEIAWMLDEADPGDLMEVLNTHGDQGREYISRQAAIRDHADRLSIRAADAIEKHEASNSDEHLIHAYQIIQLANEFLIAAREGATAAGQLLSSQRRRAGIETMPEGRPPDVPEAGAGPGGGPGTGPGAGGGQTVDSVAGFERVLPEEAYRGDGADAVAFRQDYLEALGGGSADRGRKILSKRASKWKAVNDAQGSLAATKFAKQQASMPNMLVEYWLNSILSGPLTHAVNMTSNTLNTLWLPFERAMGHAATLQFQEASKDLMMYVHPFSQIGDAITAASGAWKNWGDSLDAIGKFDAAEGYNRAITAKNVQGALPRAAGKHVADDSVAGAAVNWMGKFLNIPSRLLMTEDAFFKNLSYRATVRAGLFREGVDQGLTGPALSQHVEGGMQQMIVNGQHYTYRNVRMQAETAADDAIRGITDPDEAAKAKKEFINKHMIDNWDESRGALAKSALGYGRDITYTRPLDEQGRSGLVKTASGLNNIINEQPALRFIVPFVRTPTNLIAYFLDRTVGSWAALGKMGVKGLGNRFIQKDAKAMAEALAKGGPAKDEVVGRAATGAIFMATAWNAYHSGNLTGGGPTDPERKNMMLASGWQPYSIRVGDSWFSYRRFDPFASFFGTIADIAEAMDEADSGGRDAMDGLMGAVMLSAAKNITNKSYLTGISRFANVLTNPERFVGNYIEQTAASLFPYSSLAGQTVGTADQTQKEIRGWVDAVRVKYGLAGEGDANFEGRVDPRRNVLGDTLKRPDVLWPFPIHYTKIKDDQILQEFTKLGHGFSPPKTSRNGVDLTQYRNDRGQSFHDRWQEMHGRVRVKGRSIKQALKSLISSRAYQNLPDDDFEGMESPRIAAVRQLISKYRSRAFDETLREFPEVERLNRRNTMIKNYRRAGRDVQHLLDY